MGETVAPRKGTKSAPSDSPSPLPVTLGATQMSAPTEAPSVRSTKPVRKNGSGEMPTSVMSNEVAPKAPSKGSADSRIMRSN